MDRYYHSRDVVMRESARKVFSPIPEDDKTDRIPKSKLKKIMKKLRYTYKEMTIERVCPKKAYFISGNKLREVIRCIRDIRAGKYMIA